MHDDYNVYLIYIYNLNNTWRRVWLPYTVYAWGRWGLPCTWPSSSAFTVPPSYFLFVLFILPLHCLSLPHSFLLSVLPSLFRCSSLFPLFCVSFPFSSFLKCSSYITLSKCLYAFLFFVLPPFCFCLFLDFLSLFLEFFSPLWLDWSHFFAYIYIFFFFEVVVSVLHIAAFLRPFSWPLSPFASSFSLAICFFSYNLSFAVLCLSGH